MDKFPCLVAKFLTFSCLVPENIEYNKTRGNMLVKPLFYVVIRFKPLFLV